MEMLELRVEYWYEVTLLFFFLSLASTIDLQL